MGCVYSRYTGVFTERKTDTSMEVLVVSSSAMSRSIAINFRSVFKDQDDQS
jgi:hypothetical protein